MANYVEYEKKQKIYVFLFICGFQALIVRASTIHSNLSTLFNQMNCFAAFFSIHLAANVNLISPSNILLLFVCVARKNKTANEKKNV